MSIRATNRGWTDASVIGPRRMLLLAIADYANDEGVCWPSMRCLAKRTCLTVRRVQQLMRLLEAEDHISVTPATGRGVFNLIRIHGVGDNRSTTLSPASEENFALSAQKGEETFALSKTERVKASARRAQDSARRAKLSAQKSETLSHTRVDPLFIHNNNQQQIQKSVLFAAQTALRKEHSWRRSP